MSKPKSTQNNIPNSGKVMAVIRMPIEVKNLSKGVFVFLEDEAEVEVENWSENISGLDGNKGYSDLGEKIKLLWSRLSASPASPGLLGLESGISSGTLMDNVLESNISASNDNTTVTDNSNGNDTENNARQRPREQCRNKTLSRYVVSAGIKRFTRRVHGC
jgi:hypothetical protein